MLALSIKELSKTYSNGHQALKSINLDVPKGQFLALLGKNGAGKTTFVEILSYLTQKTSGIALIQGKDLDEHEAIIKPHIGIVPQEFNLAMFETSLRTLILQAGFFGIDKDTAYRKAKKLLAELDLWEKRDQQVLQLSGGMKRRLMIARALIHNPQIIFFDEPTAGVDIQLRKKIWDIMKDLNKKGKTIILTTHYFEEAEQLCDTLAVIAEGEIIMHDSLNSVLRKCTKHQYIIELEKNHKIANADNIVFLSTKKLEVTVSKENTLTETIANILAQGGKIHHIQPKNTRLEELFLNIT